MIFDLWYFGSEARIRIVGLGAKVQSTKYQEQFWSISHESFR